MALTLRTLDNHGWVGNPTVIEALCDGDPFCWISLQQSLAELLAWFAHVGETGSVSSTWWAACQHGMQDATNRPYIDGWCCLSILLAQYLWCHILVCASLTLLFIEVESRDAKIDDFDCLLLTLEQNIVRLQVPVDVPSAMTILNSL